MGSQNCKSGSTPRRRTNPGKEGYSKDKGAWADNSGNTCSICGAWRGQFGLEPTIELYISHTMEILKECKRVLRPDGVLFWNIGDSYAAGGGTQVVQTKNASHGLAGYRQQTHGIKPKDLCLIPFRVALAAQADGWWVRSAIIWNKPNPMPESMHGSHYIRHYVTIREYERLQSLRIAEGGNKDGPGHVPGLQAGEISACKETLSAEREGAGYSTETRGTPRCDGEAQASQPVNSGQEEQGKIRSNGKGQTKQAKGNSETQRQARNEIKGGDSQPTNQGQARTHSSKERSKSALFQDVEGQISQATGLCETEGCDCGREAGNSRGLARDIESPQEPMPLLSQEESADDRPCNTDKQRRQACEREHSASLPELQQPETGQPGTALIECPGCAECDNGLIHINGSGRPTDAYEHIFMLTKSARYYWDAEAVREPNQPCSIERVKHPFHLSDKVDGRAVNSRADGDKSQFINPAGRNLRNVWTFPPANYKEAHFATFPEALPEKCIKAATPEAGCCSKCGKPWERIVESNPYSLRPISAPIGKRDAFVSSHAAIGQPQNSSRAVETKTIGWRQACKCEDSKPVPSTVLDPFGGSGTTLLVARRLGRLAVGYELSSKYCKLIEKRNCQGVL